jgi:hypothetical protein
MNPPAIEETNKEVAALVAPLLAVKDDWMLGRAARAIMRGLRTRYPVTDTRSLTIDHATVLLEREFGWTGDEGVPPALHSNEDHAWKAVRTYFRDAPPHMRTRFANYCRSLADE